MTTPIDTTRLRERTEAVHAAGIRQRMTHDAWKATLDAVVTEDVLDLAMEYREATERFRKAKAALYADAFPEDVILSLLDEVERLRAERDACAAVISAAEAWRGGLASNAWLEGHIDAFRAREPDEGGTR